MPEDFLVHSSIGIGVIVFSGAPAMVCAWLVFTVVHVLGSAALPWALRYF